MHPQERCADEVRRGEGERERERERERKETTNFCRQYWYSEMQTFIPKVFASFHEHSICVSTTLCIWRCHDDRDFACSSVANSYTEILPETRIIDPNLAINAE